MLLLYISGLTISVLVFPLHCSILFSIIQIQIYYNLIKNYPCINVNDDYNIDIVIDNGYIDDDGNGVLLVCFITVCVDISSLLTRIQSNMVKMKRWCTPAHSHITTNTQKYSVHNREML